MDSSRSGRLHSVTHVHLHEDDAMVNPLVFCVCSLYGQHGRYPLRSNVHAFVHHVPPLLWHTGKARKADVISSRAKTVPLKVATKCSRWQDAQNGNELCISAGLLCVLYVS